MEDRYFLIKIDKTGERVSCKYRTGGGKRLRPGLCQVPQSSPFSVMDQAITLS